MTRNLLIVFFVALFFILIFLFPFKVRFMAHINLLKKKGFYSAKVLGIRVICGQIYISKDNEIIMENSIDIMNNKFSKNFVKEFVKAFLNKMDIKKIELFFVGGITNDSFASAMLCGTITSLVNTIYSILSQRYDNVKLYEDIKPSFNKLQFELTFDFVIRISIFNIILSIFKALIANNKFKEIENERWI